MDDRRSIRRRNETVWKPRRFHKDDVTRQQETIKPNPRTRLQGRFKHIPSLNFWRQVRIVEIKCCEYNQQMSSFYVNFKEDIKNVIEKKKILAVTASEKMDGLRCHAIFMHRYPKRNIRLCTKNCHWNIRVWIEIRRWHWSFKSVGNLINEHRSRLLY